MKITVIYNNGIYEEYTNVINQRRVYRQISKHCKAISKEYYWMSPMRVKRIIKER